MQMCLCVYFYQEKQRNTDLANVDVKKFCTETEYGEHIRICLDW